MRNKIVGGAAGGGVLLCTTSYPEDTMGGREAAGAFVSDFARILSERLPVTVLAPASTTGEERQGDLEVVRFRVPRLPLSLLRPADPRHWAAILETLRSGYRHASRLVSGGGYRHLFALWALPSGWWLRAASRRYGVPYSVWALGSDIWSLARLPVARAVLRGVLGEAHTLYADGLLLADEVARLAGDHCEFLPSSRKFEGERVSARSDTPPYRLAYLGRWHPNKGIDLLLRALELLEEEDWRRIESVFVAGGGPLEPEVVKAVSALQARGRPVRHAGFLDREQAGKLLDEADYLIIPSRIESIPVIFSDALQRGCPVISTPAGDLARLVPELGVGVLVRGFEPADIAQAIRQSLGMSPRSFLERMAPAASCFSVEASVELFLKRSLGRPDGTGPAQGLSAA